MALPIEKYKVYAIKYAHHTRRATDNFLGGDSHDVPMPMDYFVWAVVGESRTFIVDTGFDQKGADKRGRVITHSVEQGLLQLGIQPKQVDDVILTHMHYDHAGNSGLFPNARYHVQDREMVYCTGRCMCHQTLSHPFEPDDIKSMVDRIFSGHVQFHNGTTEITSGLSVHWVGGHSDGLQVVRVYTDQGWIVLASDASHYYANMDQNRPYPVVANVADMLEGFATIRRLSDSPAYVVPGHDPDVLKRFPAYDNDTKGWIVRLDGALL